MPRPDTTRSTLDPELGEPAVGEGPRRVAGGASVGLADLPVAGLTRRRIALAIGALVSAWVIVLFAHQVGSASEASAHAQAMRAANTAAQANVAALQAELDLIGRTAYITQQARMYRLGTDREIPFTLADNAPALPADAPGSAGVRLGATVVRPTPLESWIRLLFGRGGDPADATGAGGG
jgi:cell division protein FtsB